MNMGLKDTVGDGIIDICDLGDALVVCSIAADWGGVGE